jgi:hypothetical protein
VNNAGINQANLLRAVNAASAMKPMDTNFAGVIRVNEKVNSSCRTSPRNWWISFAAGYSQYDGVGQVTTSIPFCSGFCSQSKTEA